MWKRGGRSSALDRAQALLSAKRSSRGDAESGLEGPAAKTQGAVSGSVPPNTHTVLSDVSDLSSVSSAPEHGADTVRSAAARNTQGREEAAAKDVRPQSSLGGGGSRFLKKAPPPATNSSQSPVSRSQMQQVPEPRNVSSSLRGSQAAALSRLAQIESRIRSRKPTGQGSKLAENLTSDLRISPPAAAQSLEAPGQLSAQSSSEQSLKGKRFLKNKTVGAVIGSNAAAAAGSLQVPDVGLRSRSRAADAVVSSASVRALGSVSLESDEEDMRKLLGDSLDSADNSFLTPGRPSSRRTAGSRQVRSTPPPAAPHSPASPSHRSSPFRYTGQAQAHFSPSVLSPSPSPPRVSPQRMESPQRSISSMSGRSEVISLEELFPVEDPHSDISAASSEDFKINVLTLDDLLPDNAGFTEETSGEEREAKLSTPAPGSPNRRQLSGLKEKGDKQQQEDEEDVLDYQSDFEGESRTEQDDSASQVSEHLQGHDDEEEVESEVRGAASDSDVSGRGGADDDYSSTFSDVSRSYSSRTSDHSQTVSRSRDSRSSRSSRRSSRSSMSHSIRSFSHQPRTRTSAGKVLKETAVQTQLDPLAHPQPAGTLGPAGMAYIHPSPVITHTLSPDTVEALSSFNPAVFVLNEVLKQQLAMTRRYIESSRHLHSSLVRSLEPPNYRYTTLEDTKEYIRKRRPPKLTMEEALEEVLQEMRDYH